jgi:hypothetical protein
MLSHTTTGEWQSFETRMRRRRAERLALRAQAAADAGCWDDARTCLAEARALSPGLATLDKIEHQLPGYVPPPVDVPLEAVAEPARRRRGVAAAAVLVLAAAGVIGGWMVTRDGALVKDTGEAAASGVVRTAPEVEQPAAAEPMPSPSTVFATETAAAPIATPPAASEPVSEPPPPTAAPQDPPGRSQLPARTTDVSTGTTGIVPAPIRSEPAPLRPPPIDPPVAAAGTATTGSPPPVGVLDLPAAPPAPAIVPAPAAAPEAAPAEPSQEPAVRSVLNSYASAYSALDADAAQRVWPGVNRSALARAFDTLASQQVNLGDCRIDVAGASATATCSGTATWSAKIGDGGRQNERRRWSFELARGGRGWEIVSARVQNR